MREQVQPRSDAPSWVAALRTPVWISGPGRTISWMNGEAASLLGVSLDGAIGRPCHQIVGGRDPSGRLFCAPHCPSAGRASRGERLAPFRLSITGAGGATRWIRLLIIPVPHPDSGRSRLVHCVVTSDREARMERYLRNVANRWESLPGRAATGREGLTGREQEILELLARDLGLNEIARTLSVSYVTVRNHVQHILRKMGVHSIAEAVARWLLSEADGGP